MNQIRGLRIDRGLKQSQLAKLSGSSQTAISEYERGAKEPTLGVINALCDALDCTADELLGRDNKVG